ncbi:FprA family A-type flavoprotein [Candidatus Margulisiibacteriota bacterium]
MTEQYKQIKPNIYSVGAVDWDRKLFDALIPLPDGTSYNSYLIFGSEKTALIDTVDSAMSEVLLNNLQKLKVDRLDYIITNHAEQDHSGTLPAILKIYPQAKVICTPKCRDILLNLLQLTEDVFITVTDRETISLGDKTLEFIHAPWVHWPETMLTYLGQDNILFSCDLFGSHLAAAELWANCTPELYSAAKRYYAEIMMPFRKNILKYLHILGDKKIGIIAASHGPVYNKPEFILNAYREWTADEPQDEVVIAYVSMHGSTEKIAHYLAQCLGKAGITVKMFELSNGDIGELAMALVDAATIIVATPAVLAGAHPVAANAAFLINALRPKAKQLGIIGSFSWGCRVPEQLGGLLSGLKADMLDPVMIKGLPTAADYEALQNLAQTITEQHQDLKH